MEKLECARCKIKNTPKDPKNPIFPCDICRTKICGDCSDLSSSELKCIVLQRRILKYHCESCRKWNINDFFENTIKDKEEIIENKNAIIQILQERIKEMEEKQKQLQMVETRMFPNNISYSEITKKNTIEKINTIPNNIPKIIIRPKNVQTSIDTKKDINKSINPAELKISIENIRTTNNGGMFIKCQSKQQVDLLMKTAQDKLRNKYDISISKMRKPRIKITNYTENMTMEEIGKALYDQNNITGEIKVTYIKKNKKGDKTIYCECSSASFKNLIEKGKVYIGWERYPVFEDLDVLRCFKCQAFHHRQQECRNGVVCPNCSGNHTESNCKNHQKCCPNCKHANDKYKKNYNMEHASYDLNCPSLKYFIEVLKSKTNYQNDQ